MAKIIITLVYIVDTNERPNLNNGRPPSTHLTSDDTDYMQAHKDCSLQQSKPYNCTITADHAVNQQNKQSIIIIIINAAAASATTTTTTTNNNNSNNNDFCTFLYCIA